MLVLKDVHARYGAITALRGISIEVNEGELVALIGVNGAGKTTTLSTIAGVIRPYQGDILFQGKPLVGKNPEQIARLGIAMVPESRDIFPNLSVDENLRMGAFIRSPKRAEYLKSLEDIFSLFPILKDRIHQSGGTLSGGEQQMLAIARALLSNPRLLMLDEPSLGLAPLVVDQIFQLISTLHARGVTILLVEQNVERTLKIADRAYLLATGEVRAAGTPSELRARTDIEKVYLGVQGMNSRIGGSK